MTRDANPEFEDVAAELAPRGVVIGDVFGSRALKSGTDHAARARPGRRTSVRSVGRDQPFEDWVEVPPVHEDFWTRFAVAALDHLDA